MPYITAEQLLQFETLIKVNIKPSRAQDYAAALDSIVTVADLTTPLRLAHFIAQIAVETGYFRKLVESMGYSPEQLYKVFPKHFAGLDDAKAVCLRGGEAIAARIYGGRMGNAPEPSSDGYSYRGRGFIMTTGKYNYRQMETYSSLPLVDSPEMLEEPPHAARAAAFYWKSKAINPYADLDDIKTVTYLVNGGYIGLAERTRMLDAAKSVWK